MSQYFTCQTTSKSFKQIKIGISWRIKRVSQCNNLFLKSLTNAFSTHKFNMAFWAHTTISRLYLIYWRSQQLLTLIQQEVSHNFDHQIISDHLKAHLLTTTTQEVVSMSMMVKYTHHYVRQISVAVNKSSRMRQHYLWDNVAKNLSNMTSFSTFAVLKWM